MIYIWESKNPADYEGGRAVPNNQILTKLERALNVKLRGKDKGKPLVVDKKSGSK